MTAKFVLTRDPDGRFRFELLAGNGRVLATSAAHETRRAALDAIKSVRGNVPDAQVEDRTGA